MLGRENERFNVKFFFFHIKPFVLSTQRRRSSEIQLMGTHVLSILSFRFRQWRVVSSTRYDIYSSEPKRKDSSRTPVHPNPSLEHNCVVKFRRCRDSVALQPQAVKARLNLITRLLDPLQWCTFLRYSGQGNLSPVER